MEDLNTELEAEEDKKIAKAAAKLNPKPKMELFPKDEPIERKKTEEISPRMHLYL